MTKTKLSKAQVGAVSTSHKYIKRTGNPGNYHYWYKLPNGHIVSSDDESGPPHVDHSKQYDKTEENTGIHKLEEELNEIKKQEDEKKKKLEEKLSKEFIEKFNTTPITFLVSRDDRHNEKTIKHIAKRITGERKVEDDTPVHGFAIGAAPVLNLTFGNIDSVQKQFNNDLFKKFNKDINDLAINYDTTIIRNWDSAGSWVDTDLNTMVLEPSKRVEVLSSDNRLVRAIAAQLGKNYKQQAVYIAEYSKTGKGWEYGIIFDNLKDAEEIIAKQNDFGFYGSALNITNKTLYLGDVDGSLIDNFEQILKYLKRKGIKHEKRAKRANIEFIESKDYDKEIEEGTGLAITAGEDGRRSGGKIKGKVSKSFYSYFTRQSEIREEFNKRIGILLKQNK